MIDIWTEAVGKGWFDKVSYVSVIQDFLVAKAMLENVNSETNGLRSKSQYFTALNTVGCNQEVILIEEVAGLYDVKVEKFKIFK